MSAAMSTIDCCSAASTRTKADRTRQVDFQRLHGRLRSKHVDDGLAASGPQAGGDIAAHAFRRLRGIQRHRGRGQDHDNLYVAEPSGAALPVAGVVPFRCHVPVPTVGRRIEPALGCGFDAIGALHADL